MVLLFFSEYKITHQQASFEGVDSVFTHCLLASCFKSTVTTRGGVLEDVLGLEDVLEDTF